MLISVKFSILLCLKDLQDLARTEKHKVVIQLGEENTKPTDLNTEDSQISTSRNDPIKMLKNRPKRSSLKQSCLHSAKLETRDHQAQSNIGEVSSDEEIIPDFQLISNVFQNRRKSCHSWRGRQRSRVAGGSVSSESEVFEIIHMEDSSEEEDNVRPFDKLITGERVEDLSVFQGPDSGVLISATILAVCYLFWAQNLPSVSSL